MTQADGDRALVLRRLHHCGDRLVAGRGLGAEIDNGVRREGVAVIAVVAGIGGGRMAGDQVKDRKLVLDRAQAVFKRLAHETISSAPDGRRGPYMRTGTRDYLDVLRFRRAITTGAEVDPGQPPSPF